MKRKISKKGCVLMRTCFFFSCSLVHIRDGMELDSFWFRIFMFYLMMLVVFESMPFPSFVFALPRIPANTHTRTHTSNDLYVCYPKKKTVLSLHICRRYCYHYHLENRQRVRNKENQIFLLIYVCCVDIFFCRWLLCEHQSMEFYILTTKTVVAFCFSFQRL